MFSRAIPGLFFTFCSQVRLPWFLNEVVKHSYRIYAKACLKNTKFILFLLLCHVWFFQMAANCCRSLILIMVV